MSVLWCLTEDQPSAPSCWIRGHLLESRAVPPIGWQADTEQAEARLSTSAQARRRTTDLAEVRESLSRAVRAVEELGQELAEAVVANRYLERENERLIAELRAAKEPPWATST